MKKLFLLFGVSSIFFVACTTNGITGRSQLLLVSESALQLEATKQHDSVPSKNTVESTTKNKEAEMVKRVGKRIAAATTKYYDDKGLSNELAGYKWEFNLIDSKEVNAWCMPGGKVAVYSGLLPVAQIEDALAFVLGHEITHAVAHHGQERISHALIAQNIGLAGDIFTSGNSTANNIFKSIYAPEPRLVCYCLIPENRSTRQIIMG